MHNQKPALVDDYTSRSCACLTDFLIFVILLQMINKESTDPENNG